MRRLDDVIFVHIDWITSIGDRAYGRLMHELTAKFSQRQSVGEPMGDFILVQDHGYLVNIVNIRQTNDLVDVDMREHWDFFPRRLGHLGHAAAYELQSGGG